MAKTKNKMQAGEPAIGGWVMTGNPAVVEIMAAEGFDFLVADMEHTAIHVETFYHMILATKGTGCELIARLPACDPVVAKQVLDMGAAGIIVPSVNTPAEAAQTVAIAKYPPEGTRGAALCRATGFGRNFADYYANHNREVLVVAMIEHITAVKQVDAILATPGLDAILVGPYDLSASMGIPGQLKHPDVLKAQEEILAACRRHKIAPGIHVAPVDPADVAGRLAQGFLFVPCGIDTSFVREGCRTMLQAKPKD
jgi:2-dehydro-3-deoxyglucarate aldolase